MLMVYTMNKREIETILKINGFDTSATEDQVRAVLLSARYTEDEVNVAISTLRGPSIKAFEKNSSLQNIFYADKRLHAGEISKLLGVDVEINTPISRRSSRSTVSLVQFILVWFFSVVFAVSGILFYMYINEIGLFHSTSTVFLF